MLAEPPGSTSLASSLTASVRVAGVAWTIGGPASLNTSGPSVLSASLGGETSLARTIGSAASESLRATIDIACEVAAGGIGTSGVGRNAARTAGAAARSGEASKPSTRRSGAKSLGLGATAWGVAAATRTEAVTASGSGGEAASPGDAATGVAAATTSEACKTVSPRSRSCQTKPMQVKTPISNPLIQIDRFAAPLRPRVRDWRAPSSA